MTPERTLEKAMLEIKELKNHAYRNKNIKDGRKLQWMIEDYYHAIQLLKYWRNKELQTKRLH